MPSAALVAQFSSEIRSFTDLYKQFHASPELSMQEHNTAAKITQLLSEYGLSPFPCGGTGVVAVLENGPGEIIAYRADIDGLPITEATGLDYASNATGVLPDGTTTDVMHGCGHDIHITVALALAKLLVENRDTWSGTIVFLFQPGEEISAGARAMVADGLWDKVPRPSAIYGQHVWTGQAGTVNISSGTAMALSDSLRVRVKGKQAHGSQPENAIDPIVLGAYMITRLQTVVAREISGRDTAVVTVGTFHGGLKENIIPGEAEFTLNIRAFEESVRERVLEAIRRIILAEAQASGADEPIIEEMYSFPRCYNDPSLAAPLIGAFQGELGGDKVNVVPPVTGSEDFGVLGDTIGVPYTYWFLGAHSAENIAKAEPAGNHHPEFAPDDVETCLTTGVRTAVTAVLSHHSK